ncbi:DMT family transporter [Bradyrhizobium sp. sBnM-33]|uniref:DMT family transporter n=1 Tax=Bradyrhizobium sp. sBnM-33 TaxID=2831780 RepID=UPI001BCE5B07|nr:DMT family transporter [Bradyrhizobium sp. sBnM-33]WOH50641.1 DMT family transporter [Bradyrhizobium sp. sBnM-33]
MSEPSEEAANRTREVLGLLGFLLVATAQVSNMILARGVAGTVPPFSIAFFRWSIVALGLLPAIVMALREKPGLLQGQTLGIVAAGFLGMFVCGGPVYVAGVTTSAINLALIMALSPLAVLLFSFVSGQESIHRNQIIGMLLSLVGAALIITKGQATIGAGVVTGDLLALMAMLGWAGYTLLQNRVGSGVSFLARIGLFAAAGALFSLPFAIHEMWSAPAAAFSGRAALVYLFAGLVPGLFAYSAYAYLGAKFGAVSTSLSLYLGPIVSAVLSILFLGEAPTMIHLIGGALSLGGMWLSLQAKQGGSSP